MAREIRVLSQSFLGVSDDTETFSGLRLFEVPPFRDRTGCECQVRPDRSEGLQRMAERSQVWLFWVPRD